MSGYGQFCAVARAHEVSGGRWTLLIVRELLMGSRRFNDIRRGIPRISRTMLSERLQELVEVKAISRQDGGHGPEYDLTESGRELGALVMALGQWGQRWLPRRGVTARSADLPLKALLPVDVFGQPADLDPLLATAREFGLSVLHRGRSAPPAHDSPGSCNGLLHRGDLRAHGTARWIGVGSCTVLDRQQAREHRRKAR